MKERWPVGRPRSLLVLPHLLEWTQQELAKKSGVGVTTIVRAEAGHAVSALIAQRLAKALDVAITQLREEPPPDEVRWLQRHRPSASGGDA